MHSGILSANSAVQLGEQLDTSKGLFSRIKFGSTDYRDNSDDMSELVDVCHSRQVDFLVGGGVWCQKDVTSTTSEINKMVRAGVTTAEIPGPSAWVEGCLKERIDFFRGHFDQIIVEIGDNKNAHIPRDQFARELDICLENDVDLITFEGASECNAGIYYDRGSPRSLLVLDLLSQARGAHEKILLESKSPEMFQFWVRNGLPNGVSFANLCTCEDCTQFYASQLGESLTTIGDFDGRWLDFIELLKFRAQDQGLSIDDIEAGGFMYGSPEVLPVLSVSDEEREVYLDWMIDQFLLEKEGPHKLLARRLLGRGQTVTFVSGGKHITVET